MSEPARTTARLCQRSEAPWHRGSADLKVSSGWVGPGGEAGEQWGAVSAPLAWPRQDGLSA